MMKMFYLSLILFLSGSLWADATLKPTDDPEVLHRAHMNNLQAQADAWAKIAQRTKKRETRRLYSRLARNYLDLKMYRERLFLSKKNGTPFHYEMLWHHHRYNRHYRKLAEAAYGKGHPVMPKEVKPKKTPVPKPEPAAETPATVTTPSGFNVLLRLEE